MRFDLTVTTTPGDEVCHLGWTLRDDEGDYVVIGSMMGDRLSTVDVETAALMALAHLWQDLERAGGVQGHLLDPQLGEAPMSTREF